MSYLEARKALGLSRERLSGLAKLAGIRVSPTLIKKLEDEGDEATGRGLSDQVVGYLSFVLGLGEYADTDWSTIQSGAPVVVDGHKGVYSFISADGGEITVFGTTLLTVSAKDARPAAPSGVPSGSNAHLFEKRSRGDGGVYSKQVMNYVEQHADMPHGVGAIAAALGLDNAVVSRTVAALTKAGRLVKVGRGVVALADSSTAPAAAEASASENSGEAIPEF